MPDIDTVPHERVGFELLADRPAEYGGRDRAAIVHCLTPPLRRVLDVGCAKGASAPLLRARGASYLAGIELEPGYAEAARHHYDEVVNRSVEDDLPWTPESFDTVLCYDVLEHLVDPWSTVKRLARLLVGGGQLHVSVPNARHPGTWLPIIAKGSFDYRAQGLRDVTHLRFFGRRDVRAMLRATGLHVGKVDPVPSPVPVMRLAMRLSRGMAAEFAAYQWHVIATAGDSQRSSP
jgi:2-polyprenyl-3-methyl-5-hydroxy-6-metoxy-1,4-benzoquinol methylase